MKYMCKLLLIILVISVTSCNKDWLDVNKNPNVATDITPEYLFGGVITSWSGNRYGGDSWLPIAFMNQIVSTGGSNGWGAEDEYDISPYSLGNTWKLYYATGGANIKKAIDIAEQKGRRNVAAQCKIVFATMIYECTMIYGDIPYSQGWSDITDPIFDNQKDVLESLIKLLDEAIDEVDVSDDDAIKNEDLYFSGNMEKWIRFANSVKFKIAMVMVDKDPSKSSLIGDLIALDKLIDMEDYNVKFPFSDEAGHKNPMYRILEKYNAGANDWFFANTTILDQMMIPLDDPRIPIYYKAGEKSGGVFKGVKTSEDAVRDESSLLNEDCFLRSDMPDLILSCQEVNMLIAEAYLRGLGVPVDKNKADFYFKKGLEQALNYYGVSASDITSFKNKAELDLKTAPNALYVLKVQQYVDLAGRPLESWVQQRRSGDVGYEIPNLSTPALSTQFPPGKIARRWQYAPGELSGNSNAPKTIPNMWDNMWFDK